MTHPEALEFIRRYFDELFGKRNLDALDAYLAPDYFDDDIGDPNEDHRRNSKAYLRELFETQPTIAVEVRQAAVCDNVISAYLEWYVVENGARKSLRKGVALFVVRGQQIVRRHTFIYEGEA